MRIAVSTFRSISLGAAILVAGAGVAMADTMAGPTTEHGNQTYTEALNLLEASGYTGITSLFRNGPEFTAMAWHNGKHESVVVDPSARTIDGSHINQAATQVTGQG